VAVLLLGWPAPAVRSAVMLVVTTLSAKLQRPVHDWSALALGAALAALPAVRGFAIFSCLAIAFDYLLQMGAFLAMLVLLAPDDVAEQQGDGEAGDAADEAAAAAVVVSPRVAAYAAWLLRPRVSAAVLAVAGAAAGASLAALPRMRLGLDQASALPPDSYLAPYFAAVASQLQVGPPVYWVLQSADPTQPVVPYWDLPTQNALTALPCAFPAGTNATTACDPSLVARLGACGRGAAGADAHLAGAPNDWLGDFIRWLDPATALCRTAAAAPPASGDAVPAPCAAADAAAADAAGCGVCGAARDEASGAAWVPAEGAWLQLADGGGGGPPRPTRATFEAHLPLFLASRCSASATSCTPWWRTPTTTSWLLLTCWAARTAS
jgi:hypothetical protein